MKPEMERALGATLEEHGSFAHLDVVSFRQLMVEALGDSKGVDGSRLSLLARYAVDEGVALIQTATPVIAKHVPAELVRATVHHNSQRLLGPSWMTDNGMKLFQNIMKDENVAVRPAPEGKLPFVHFVGFDFDYYTNPEVTGCPAHYLPLSDVLPIEPIADHPNVASPQTFLDQFFRLTADITLPDLQIPV